MYKIERTRMQLAGVYGDDNVVIPLTDEEVRAIYEQKKHDYAIEDVMNNAEHPELFKENPDALEDVVSKYLEAMDNDDTWYHLLMEKVWDAEAELMKPKAKTYSTREFAQYLLANPYTRVIFGTCSHDMEGYKIRSLNPFGDGDCYILSDWEGDVMEVYNPKSCFSVVEELSHFIVGFFVSHFQSDWTGTIYVKQES